MRYAFTVAGATHSVTLQEHADGPKFEVDGEVLEPKVKPLGKGHYEVHLDGQRYEFRIHNGIVMEGARQLDLEVRRDRPQLERSRIGGRKGDGKVKPPMPGKVVEIKVKEGQDVAEGDVLLVLEAMKMQNDLKSPSAGKVVRVHVQEGANVEASTVLVEIQAAPSA